MPSEPRFLKKKKKGPRYILYEVAGKTPQSPVPILSRPLTAVTFMFLFLYTHERCFTNLGILIKYSLYQRKKKKRKKEIKENICIYIYT